MKTLYALIGLLTVCPAWAASPQADVRPNVVVILADDMGYADAGFQDRVAQGVVTPNLNRLAESGVVFTSGYSDSPICSVSRLALSTGRYPQRWGGYYYGEGGFTNEEFSIAEMMRSKGYRTMKVGKTHLNRGPKSDPMLHGFDHWLGFKQHSWEFNLLSEKDAAAYENKKKGSVQQARNIGIGPLTRDSKTKASFENTTSTEVFGQESVRFIEEESDQPFYLQLEFNAVHTPLYKAPNRAYAERYGIPERPFHRDDEVWAFPHWDPIAQPDYKKWYDQVCHLGVVDPYGRKLYLAHLELMDEVIGQVIASLEAEGVRDNTLIFFSSDNGGSHQSYADNGDLNAYKFCLMDGGIRVPMVVAWPDGIPGGQRLGATARHMDLFPTLAEILSFDPINPLDGRSLLPVMRGEASVVHPEPVFWDSGAKRNNWVVREGDWKLVYRKNGRAFKVYQIGDDGLVEPEVKRVTIPSGFQLYNIAQDMGETTNLVGQHPERVEHMKTLYADWRGQMLDPVRTPR